MPGVRRGPVRSLTVGIVFLLSALFGGTFSDRDGNNDKSKQLAVEVFNSTSIALRWSEPKRSGAGGGDARPCPVQRYVIRLKQDGQKQARTWRFDGARLSVTLHDLRPATAYQVRLLSIDCENKRKTSRWTRVATSERPAITTTHETRAPSKPTEVRTITMSESVVATWRPPEDGALVRGYIVGYGEGVPDVNWRYVNASQRNVTLRNLKPKTRYVISVRAFNNMGKGQVTYDIVSTKEAPVSTASAGVLPAPTHLRSRMLSPTTTLLQWSDPSLDPTTQRIADERYYNVYYQSLPGGKNLSVIVKALQVTLYDLLPSKGYRFTVRTIKGSSTSPFSAAVVSRTPSAGSSETQRKTSETTKAKPTSPTTDENNNNNNDDDDDDDDSDNDDDDDDFEMGRQDVFVVDRHGNGVVDGGGEAKAKRANVVVVHESLARTLTSSAATNASSMTSPSSDVRVAFRFAVQYRVSAYVTWPERLVPCPAADDDVRAAGYLFRYRAVDDDVGDHVIRSLTSNFVLLENLVPNTSYKYQVKYLTDRGSAPGWSQEATLDTSYSST